MRTRVENLFHELADLPPEERGRYLAEHDVDPGTRREVEALLAFDSDSTVSLPAAAGILAHDVIEGLDPEAPRCGPYRLKSLLGRGGMGAVYSAERDDGEISHRVAVKLLRPGMNSAQLRERFLAERQILANLGHPNIAVLLDAGHLPGGQPYLVMEYVNGTPIDEYARGLPLQAKIRLFIKVCGAVAYLHRNLVVHRDLKPSNILVTPEGEPKLLDFGIAKIIDLAADMTVTTMRMMTPEYGSPEQAGGGSISTASDIYSLGALLYKLLTGTSPHRLSGDSAESMISSILRGPITPPSRLRPTLKGDLELVILRALRKDPQARYSTVDQFSDDLENYLESRPIRARKGEVWYLARKFTRRYWLPLAATGLGVSCLVAGLVTANRERAIAQQRFMEVRQLSNKLFDIDAEVRKLPGSAQTRRLIAQTSQEYLRHLSSDRPGDTGLTLELGTAYMRLARVQGVPISANLGQMDQADRNLVTAQMFMRSILAEEPGNRLAQLRSAQIAHDRMLIARLNDRDRDALALASESAEWLGKFQAVASDRAEAPAILNAYVNVADQFALARKYTDALQLCRRGIELAGTLGRPAYKGSLLWVSADVWREQGEPEKALADLRESVRVLEPPPGGAEQDRTMNYLLALIYEARVLGEDGDINVGRPSEAVAAFGKAFDVSDGIVHQDANNQNSRGRLAEAGLGMADILRHSDPRRALGIYDHVLQHLAEIPNNPSFRRYEARALAGSSGVLTQLNRLPEAAARLEAARERLHGLGAYPAAQIDPDTGAGLTLRAAADFQAASGHLKDAAGLARDLLSRVDAWQSRSQLKLSDAAAFSRLYSWAADLLRRAGEDREAARLDSRRLTLWREWQPKFPASPFASARLAEAGR